MAVLKVIEILSNSEKVGKKQLEKQLSMLQKALKILALCMYKSKVQVF